MSKKDLYSNILGIAVLLGQAAVEYMSHLEGNEVSYKNLGFALAIAVLSYLTGKAGDLKKE